MTDPERTEESSISNLIIWNNQFILNHNLIARTKHYTSRGLIYFKDLYDHTNKKFKTIQDLARMHNIVISQFDYMALLSSIPRNIKNKIKLYQPPTTTYQLGEFVREVCLQPKTTKYAYTKFVKKM